MTDAIFVADDGATGRELWITNGTDAGTRRLADLNPGIAGSDPSGFTIVGGRVVFSANTAAGGRELYAMDADGSNLGLLLDIAPGTASSTPSFLRIVDGKLLFSAQGANGRELYVTDGTAAGTKLLMDIRPGTNSSSPAFVGQIGDVVVFQATTAEYGRELWASDGETAWLLVDANPGAGNPTLPTNPNTSPPVPYVPTIGATGKLFWTFSTPATGHELWVTDGTAAGTRMVNDFVPGATSSNVTFLSTLGARLVFLVDNAGGGRELWSSDGSSAGTFKLTDAPSGFAGSAAVIGGKLFLTMGAGIDKAPWVTDGTVAGTLKLADIGTGIFADFTAVGDKVIFLGDSVAGGEEPWVTDGTAAGTHQLADLVSDFYDSNPGDITAYNGKVLFRARGAANDWWLYSTDGTSVQALKSLGNFNGSIFSSIGEIGGKLIFKSAVQGGSGNTDRLWVTDGTAAGTIQLRNFEQDFSGRNELPTDFTKVGDRYVFLAGDTTHGRELWTTDGTAAGTRMLFDSLPGARNGVIASLRVVDGLVYFSATTDTGGAELWATDGTVAGTHMVKDINPAMDLSQGTSVNETFEPLGDGYLFQVTDVGGEGEPWFTDGTAAGTTKLGDLNGYVDWGVTLGGLRVFVGQTTSSGRELWVTDGTAAGTRMIEQISAGSADGIGFDARFVALGDKAVFFPNKGSAEFWVTDGTADGTFSLVNLGAGNNANVLYRLGDKVLVELGRNTGNELWVTDGTVAGSVKLANASASSGSFIWPIPPEFMQVGEKVVFRGKNGAGQEQLWVTDGTVAGTGVLKDINPSGGTAARDFGRVGDKWFFLAEDGSAGSDLWITDGTAAGTIKLVDLPQIGSNSPNILGLNGVDQMSTLSDGRVLFVQRQFETEHLWVSDGTAAGTFALGTSGDQLQGNVAFVEGQAYFSYRGNNGVWSLWTTDGTVAGTFQMPTPSLQYNATNWGPGSNLNGDFLYVAADSGNVMRLWATDGTVAGTRIISDTPPVSSEAMIVFNGKVLFQGGTGSNRELWVANGQAGGATSIEIVAGASGGYPYYFTALGDFVYFGAITGPGANSYELWKTDGVTASKVSTLNLGALDDEIEMRVIDGQLVFMANDGVNGFELWSLDGTSGALTQITNATGVQSGTPGPVVALPAPPPPPPSYEATLTGTVAGNTINGGATRDLIQGLGGNDTLSGLDGNDRIEGGEGSDKLNGGAGQDILVGGAGTDTLTGGADADTFVFGLGDGVNTITDFQLGSDRLDLTAIGGTVTLKQTAGGVRVVFSDGGYVTLTDVQGSSLTNGSLIGATIASPPPPPPPPGPPGFDTLIVGTFAGQTLNGTAGQDLIQGVGGNDTLNGLAFNDQLEGGDGNDKLNGGDGNDVLVGGAGTDMLSGGVGMDRFVFAPGDGANIISDFDVGVDLIDVTAFGGYASIKQYAPGARITFADGSYVTLTGVQASSLTDDSFVGLSTPMPVEPPKGDDGGWLI